jgi:hypothetical protein
LYHCRLLDAGVQVDPLHVILRDKLPDGDITPIPTGELWVGASGGGRMAQKLLEGGLCEGEMPMGAGRGRGISKVFGEALTMGGDVGALHLRRLLVANAVAALPRAGTLQVGGGGGGIG